MQYDDLIAQGTNKSTPSCGEEPTAGWCFVPFQEVERAGGRVDGRAKGSVCVTKTGYVVLSSAQQCGGLLACAVRNQRV